LSRLQTKGGGNYPSPSTARAALYLTGQERVAERTFNRMVLSVVREEVRHLVVTEPHDCARRKDTVPGYLSDNEKPIGVAANAGNFTFVCDCRSINAEVFALNAHCDLLRTHGLTPLRGRLLVLIDRPNAVLNEITSYLHSACVICCIVFSPIGIHQCKRDAAENGVGLDEPC
jgi:hypothetical protein